MSMFKKQDIRQRHSGEPRGLFGKSDKQRAEMHKAYEEEQKALFIKPKDLKVDNHSLQRASTQYLPSSHQPAAPALQPVTGQVVAALPTWQFEARPEIAPPPPREALRPSRIYLPE